jgi:AraC-like DNA-binding protein
LYVRDVGGNAVIRAWQPEVVGIREVLHASFTEHAYPSHTHDTWALLMVDDGVVAYDLDRHEHGALRGVVSVLPPGVPHDGRSMTAGGFRKRVLYVEPEVIGADLVGRAVDHPGIRDPALGDGIGHLHEVLAGRHRDPFEADSRLALVVDRLRRHLGPRGAPRLVPAPALAHRLRSVLDDRVTEPVTLVEVARELQASPAHLIRTFGHQFGISPHRYLTGRRVERARALLLAGERPSDVAVAVGFHDQSHLSRHFKAMLGVPPGRFARV